MSKELSEFLTEHRGIHSVSLKRLEELHHKKKLSLSELTERLNTDMETVCMRMSKGGIEMLCDTCQAELSKGRERLNFCSEQCYQLQKGNAIVCPDCGDRIQQVGRWVAHKDKNGHYGNVLMKTSNYEDDMHVSWTAQRRVALHNSNGVCQMCNSDGELDVHHLIKQRFFDVTERSHAIENLITLCRECHSRHENSGVKEVLRRVNQ
jgi:5-methylcytosine-specific restriction endonuclease McrA